MKRLVMSAVLVAGLMMGASGVLAQDAAPAAAAPAAVESVQPTESAKKSSKDSTGFLAVVLGSGWLGVVLWLALFGCGAAAIYFVVDCSILIRPQKIMPQALIEKVKGAMAEGDVMKALHACESEPGPMANILSAGSSMWRRL